MAEANDNEIPILSRLRPAPGAVRNKRRKGRGPGSGLGKTAGRGIKGQKSRSGSGKRVGFEGGQMPLQRRLPKMGFNNPFSKKIEVVNLDDLARHFPAGADVTPEQLLAKRLVRKHYDGVKILGRGELSHALTVRAHAFSGSAKEKIEQAGGTTEVLATAPPKQAGAAEG